MSRVIKACPVCSPRYSNPQLRKETLGYTVMCYGFDCREWSGWHPSSEEAIDAWNHGVIAEEKLIGALK